MKDVKGVYDELVARFPKVEFKLEDGTIFIVHRGMEICDPFWSECERFQVKADYYGIDETARGRMCYANSL